MSEDILQQIKETVEQAVDTKINGKLIGIKAQLTAQDKVLEEVKSLMSERKFLIQLWAFLKVIGGVVVAVGGAILMFKKLKP